MRAAVVAGLLLTPPMASSQGTAAGWSVITSMRPVHAVVSDGAHLWAATAGGVLRVDPTTGTATRFTHLDGLARGAVLCATVDANGDLWFGTSAGGLSRYSTHSGTFDPPLRAFEGIRLHSLTVAEGLLYVGSDRGVSVVPIDLLRVRESYRELGRLSRDTPVHDVLVHDGQLWVATPRGVAMASLAAANLQDPDSWISWAIDSVEDLLASDDGVLAAGKRGVLRQEGIAWVDDEAPRAATTFLDDGDRLLVAAGTFVYERRSGRWLLSGSTETAAILDLARFGPVLWAATSGGLRVVNGVELDVGDPPSSQFFDLALGADGRVWVASVPNDRVGLPQGLFELDGTRWRVHDRQTGLESNTVVAAAADPVTGLTWAGTWGSGLAVLDNEGRWHSFDESNSALRGILKPAAPSFVVVPDIVPDAQGHVWATNLQRGVVVFRGFPSPQSLLLDAEHFGLGSTPGFGPLAIEPERGLKWIGSDQGVAVLDDGGTPFQPADDRVHLIRGLEEPRLTSDAITALAVSQDILWIGTAGGLHRVTYRYDVAIGLQLRNWRSYRLEHGLESASITAIALDDLGNAWVGTEEGITQISFTGAVVHTFTTGNSGLVDDRVTSVRYDAATGGLWIGTFGGLSRLQITTRQDAESGTVALVFPNPFDPVGGASLSFAGLPLDANLRVYAVDGSLVATVEGGPGGTASWNGRLADGQPLAAGVYFYVAESRSGRVQGAVAVIPGSRR